MNKKLYFSICLCTMCAFFAVWSIVLSVKLYNVTQREYTAGKNKTEIIVEPVKTNKIEGYLIIYENDDVNLYSVFENGSKNFNKTLDISTNLMRETDKKAFQRGIMLESEEDVLHLIEDYTS